MENVTPSNAAPNPSPEEIPLYERFVLWMFLLGFILFGMILLADLFIGLAQ